MIVAAIIGLITLLALILGGNRDAFLISVVSAVGVITASLFARRVPRLPAILAALVFVALLVRVLFPEKAIPEVIIYSIVIGLQSGLAGSAIDKNTVTEKLVWSWRKASIFFVGVMVPVFTIILIMQFVPQSLNTWVQAISQILPFGITFMLALGWETSTKLDPPEIPNQGFWKAVRNIRRVGTIFLQLLFLNVILMFLAGEFLGTHQEAIDQSLLIRTLTLYLFLIAIFGLPIILSAGGAACIQHLALRAVLRLVTPAPWKIDRFLDEAAQRSFLLQAGGGFLFMHRLLLEYFDENPV